MSLFIRTALKYLEIIGQHISNICTHVVKKKKQKTPSNFSTSLRLFKMKKKNQLIKEGKKPLELEILALYFTMWTIKRVVEIYGSPLKLYYVY